MSARTEVYALLKAGLPTTWRVYGHDIAPTLDRKTVMVYTERVVPGVTFGFLQSTIAVWLLTPKQTGGTDEVESMLSQVLDVLDTSSVLSWDSAEYRVYNETYPAYQVTVQVTTRKDT